MFFPLLEDAVLLADTNKQNRAIFRREVGVMLHIWSMQQVGVSSTDVGGHEPSRE